MKTRWLFSIMVFLAVVAVVAGLYINMKTAVAPSPSLSPPVVDANPPVPVTSPEPKKVEAPVQQLPVSPPWQAELHVQVQYPTKAALQTIELLDAQGQLLRWQEDEQPQQETTAVNVHVRNGVIQIDITPATSRYYRVEFVTAGAGNYQLTTTRATIPGRPAATLQRTGMFDSRYVTSHVISMQNTDADYVTPSRHQLLAQINANALSNCPGTLVATLKPTSGAITSWVMQVLDAHGRHAGVNPWQNTANMPTSPVLLVSDSDELLVRVGTVSGGQYALTFDYQDCRRHLTNLIPEAKLSAGDVHSYFIAPRHNHNTLAVSLPRLHPFLALSVQRDQAIMPVGPEQVLRHFVVKVAQEDLVQREGEETITVVTDAGKLKLSSLPSRTDAAEFNRQRIGLEAFLHTWLTNYYAQEGVSQTGGLLEIFAMQAVSNPHGLKGACAYVAVLPPTWRVDQGYFRDVLSNPEEIRGPYCLMDMSPKARTPAVAILHSAQGPSTAAMNGRVAGMLQTLRPVP